MKRLLTKNKQRTRNHQVVTRNISRQPVRSNKASTGSPLSSRQNNGETTYKGREHAPDYMILVIALSLIAVGAIIGYTNSPGLTEVRGLPADFYTQKQFIAIIIGLVAFVVTSRMKIDTWKKLVMPAVISATVVAITVRLFGTPIYGAYRWLDVAGISIQAAEVIKFALVLWLSFFIYERRREGTLFDVESIKKVGAASVLILVVVAGLQSDLGSGAVMIAMIFFALFIAGLPKKYILYSIVALIIAGALTILPSAYRVQRVETFLNPTADCQDTGYQVCQALITVGSGGVVGKGLGRSVQAYGYLPEALSDSIFAIIAENVGFIGAALVILLFVELYRRLHKVAVASVNPYHRYLVYMILIWFASQTAINIGAMIGMLPLKGITLPFISYGGTSIIFVLAALGICFKISRFTDLRAARVSELTEETERTNYRQSSMNHSDNKVFRRR